MLDRWIADTFENAPETPAEAAQAAARRRARSKTAEPSSVPQQELLPLVLPLPKLQRERLLGTTGLHTAAESLMCLKWESRAL